ncbi:TolC family outer membrane protein [Marinomonas mediterranea]|uniref:TolC family outer membrane protein n=1 Tax=Marinomonas mediterranea TaxID=119864 RepID=UPI00234BE57C|nr:TolC family outer membrane protein [Marinomonas mediterranea]WCN08757.1 TolC family outer membrane protein [Marinomonas mediterranea]WCN12802.1 TolC family outer membrane protein [Marinomonas mediterranea]
MKKHIISAIVTAAACSAPLHAETLLEVYQLAQKHDPGLRAAAATYRSEQESVTSTKGSLYPSISFSGSLGYGHQEAPKFGTDYTSNSLSLDLNYPIYSPALDYAVDAVEIQFDSAGVDLENAKEDLASNTLKEYFQLLIAKATLDTVEAQVKSTASQLERVQKQYDVGLVSITDLQDARAEYDSVRVTELSAKSDVVLAQKTLQQRTGKVLSDIPALSERYPIKVDPSITAESMIAKAKQNNKSLQSLELAVQAAQKNVDIQKSNGRVPTVAITGSISRADNDYSDVNPDTEGVTTDANIGIGVSIPLYSGGSISAKVRQATASAEAAYETKASNLQTIELSIRSAVLGLQTTSAQVEAQRQLIVSRKSALEATQAGYDVGTRNLVELLSAQSNLYSAQSTYETLRYNFVIQQVALYELTGELTLDKINDLNTWLVQS